MGWRSLNSGTWTENEEAVMIVSAEIDKSLF